MKTSGCRDLSVRQGVIVDTHDIRREQVSCCVGLFVGHLVLEIGFGHFVRRPL